MRAQHVAGPFGVGAGLTLDEAALLVELGVDLVIDEEGTPWLVEVNGKPRGRLEVLAGRDAAWQEAHVRVSARPLRWLAQRFLSAPA